MTERSFVALTLGSIFPILCLSLAFAAPKRPTPFFGYSAASQAEQERIELGYRAIPSTDSLRRQHRHFTEHPHPAGSERNNELARYVEREWKRYGLEDVQIHRYDVLVSFPEEVMVEMVEPIRFRASLREEPYEVDPDTRHPQVQAAYTALSASGDILAPLIYANSGNPEDYQLLRENGIDPSGKIAIVRYSNPYSYRGFKALTAEREGVAALLIYSDPAEDGYGQGEVFPDGPWGPESHIQRGAITYDFLAAGDPLTPGWPSIPGARHLAMDEAPSVPKIVAAPLSWKDAKPLLEQIGGPPAPRQWQGALPITYTLGGDSNRVHVRVRMDTRLRPNYVVEGRIKGGRFPDEWVLLGNHRDAWEFGGVDPSSGSAVMMEVARAMGELLKSGARPDRTIVFCSWDGEEVALTGSTEWGEQFAEELSEKLVTYLNVDYAASGKEFRAAGVASLGQVMEEVCGSIAMPSGKSLVSEWKRAAKDVQGAASPLNSRIGSGTDHTVFLNHLGRPVIDMSFEGPYGVYHSMYDDFFWMNRFGDPGYEIHLRMAHVWGGLALRLANSDVLPFDFEVYGKTLGEFLGELRHDERARRLVVFAPLLSGAKELEKSGRRLRRLMMRLQEGAEPGDEVLAQINQQVMGVESGWLNEEGLPGRPWFKHLLYACRYTYAHLELPGLTESVEAGNADAARKQSELLLEAIESNTRRIAEIAAALESALGEVGYREKLD